MTVNRRDFLRKAASVPTVAALAGTLAQSTSKAQAQAKIQPTDLVLPEATSSGIEHIVVVMMENRSFDHLLGWLPNANGMQLRAQVDVVVLRGIPKPPSSAASGCFEAGF